MNFSIINYYGETNRSRCGYCKGTASSYSHGMHAYTLTNQDYQDLIDRGWRRSGEYCYKPNNSKTCCPCYTIRCDVNEFKLSKSHKKILKRMSKFLKDGIKDEVQESDEKPKINEDNSFENNPIVDIPEREENVVLTTEDFCNIKEKVSASNARATKRVKTIKTDEEHGLKSTVSEKISEQISEEDSFNKIKKQCKKAKLLRLEKKKAKLEAKGLTLDLAAHKNKNKEKNLDDFLNEASENDRHKLKLRLLEVGSRECLSNLKETFALFGKYQTVIHNDPPESLKEFLSFLQKSPLKHQQMENGPPEGYGSFHQQYWLDDKLIAVGVIDILPYCLSSVYFFYDPDYSFLSLGTYGTLREIDFVNKLSRTVPSLKYYYMGFYIHSCPKMKYKGKLSGSYLLCSEKYTWHSLNDDIRAKLDNKKYQKFDDNPNSRDEQEFTENDLNDVLIMFQRNSYSPYSDLKQMKSRRLDKTLLEYGNLVGKECAHRILYLNF